MSSSIGSIPQNLTVPVSELVRARVSENPVALPVRGGIYARLNHISAVPARSSDAGYSLSRLRAIDSLISRIARMNQNPTPDVSVDPVEQQEQLLDEVARLLSEGAERAVAGAVPTDGLLIDLSV